jgi:predicted transcriptional regulator
MPETPQPSSGLSKPATLGDQEWDVFQFVCDRAPVTVREVAQEWGEPRGLARTTILTVMERLRQKSFLTRNRRESENTFEYRPAVAKSDLMRSRVAEFVQRTLGGSLTPFVAYLTDSQNLSERERDALRRMVAEWDKDEQTNDDTKR